jgi:hypothetical protein
MMNSAKLMEKQTFKASEIPRFSVLRVPHAFAVGQAPISKLFVVIAHHGAYAICLKATSNTQQYENDKERMAGCVYFPAGELKCFPISTAVEPENQHPISHTQIESEFAAGKVEIHTLPDDFQARLLKAVQDSDALNGVKRARLRLLIQ